METPAEAGRRIARESLRPDILSEFDRTVVGGDVRFTVPISDSVDIVRCMRATIAAAERVIAVCQSRDLKEREKQSTSRAILTSLRQKLYSIKKMRHV